MMQPTRHRTLFSSQLLTALNLHLAGVLLLLAFDLVLGTKLLLAWQAGRSDQSAQYEADQRTYAQLETQAGRLRALPSELQSSRTEAGAFVEERIPTSFSVLLNELGTLTARNHVRLSRAAYPVGPAVPGIVEARIDANVTGEYTPVMHFLNAIERDKNHAFFIIRSVTLTGQQGGMVNLRVRMTTYLRGDMANAALQSAAAGAQGNGEDR